MLTVDLSQKKLRQYIRVNDFHNRLGKIERIVGTTIEATGINCNVGDVCHITLADGAANVISEAVGFKEGKVLLMPYEDIEGIGYESVVRNTGEKLKIRVSEEMIGRTVNALAQPIDDLGTFTCQDYYSISGTPSNPMKRPPISKPIEMGVKAIDGMLTIGKGQRMGIFAGSGVGKSTLMGMIARNVKADVNVIALVGERGREVLEFIHRDLGPEGAKRSVVVVATSDQPAMMRFKCAMTATTIAEFFRDRGMDVLLMMDSVTRFCMAQREIGLSIGEPPVVRGYTPSIYASLPKLLERSGNFEKGSITGIYTVLVEGDDSNEPISDTVRGIIDGHIMLSRKVAMKNHYPAIDVLGSISRLASSIISPEHKAAANEIRNIMSVYQDNQDLISIGAYKPGTNKQLDYAISKIDEVNEFLQQRVENGSGFEQTLELLKAITVNKQ